jgi:predicted regulator of Ras-like GTPase activity (Roadblock/LC7/MglB family)
LGRRTVRPGYFGGIQSIAKSDGLLLAASRCYNDDSKKIAAGFSACISARGRFGGHNLLLQGSCGRWYRAVVDDRLVLMITVVAMRKLRKS